MSLSKATFLMRVSILFSKEKKFLEMKFKDFVWLYNRKYIKTILSERCHCNFQNIAGDIFIVLETVNTANFLTLNKNFVLVILMEIIQRNINSAKYYCNFETLSQKLQFSWE